VNGTEVCKSCIARIVIVAMLSVCFAQFALAQATAAMSGRVEDTSGAGIGGATVTLVSVETGSSRVITTDEDGSYRILALPVGRYEIRAEKAGFKAQTQTGLNLVVGQQAVVNVKLEVGALQEQVTVMAEAQLVNTSTESVSGLVGEQQVKELPLNGRSFDNLITLNPGTLNYTSVARNQASSGTGTNMFSVGGKRPNANIFMLNGIEYTGTSNVIFTPGGASGQLLGIDAVREFNVISDAYGAEYGKRSGGQILVVTQSGTNRLHGSLFEFARNSDFDARNYFDHSIGTPPFKRHQFGGALGGPIRRDKVFIFGNYERFTQRLGISSVSNVPDLNMRNGLLPCGGTGGVACPTGVAAGTPTPVPNLDRRMLPYINTFWPEPNGGNVLTSTGALTGIALAYSNPAQQISQNFGTVRVDQNLSSKNTVSESYTIDDGTNLNPTAADPVFASNAIIRNQIATVQETHIFSPSVINSLSVGFSRANNQSLSYPLQPIQPNLFFVPGTASPGAIVIGAVGAFTSQGLSSAGSHTSFRTYRRNLYTVNDGLQMIRGKHTFSFGGWFQRIQENDMDGLRGSGQASFSGFASLLQGQITNLQVTPKVGALGWRSWEAAWFVQDSIQLKPNLTVRIGLRHEFSNGWNEVNGQAGWYPFVNGVIQTLPVIEHQFGDASGQKRLFGPRLGIAWDPFGKGKTSIRAGAGIYYDLVDTLSYLVDQTPPVSGAAQFNGQSLFTWIPVTPASQPPACNVGVPQPCVNFAPKGTQANYNTPAVYSWNLTVEQQLSGAMALSVGYVGFRGVHQFVTTDPNTIPAQVCSNPAGCLAGGVNAAKTTVAQGTKYIPVGTRPNPYLASGIFLITAGNANYNALQVDVRRRLAAGLQFRANYTWSKSMDESSGLIGNIHANDTQTPSDPYRLHQDYAPSAMDIRHQVSGNLSYELPFGKGKQWMGGVQGAADKLVSGWELNSIVTHLSGFDLTPFIGANQSGNGDTNAPDRPSLVPGFTADTAVTGNPNAWFNPNAFALQPSGTFGTLGRGRLRGPGLANWDLSVSKNTTISERVRLQFRAEAFNIVNHTNFGAPVLSLFANGQFSPTAGKIQNTTTTSRQLQFGMKLIF
jgi:hypothetical protein